MIGILNNLLKCWTTLVGPGLIVGIIGGATALSAEQTLHSCKIHYFLDNLQVRSQEATVLRQTLILMRVSESFTVGVTTNRNYCYCNMCSVI